MDLDLDIDLDLDPYFLSERMENGGINRNSAFRKRVPLNPFLYSEQPDAKNKNTTRQTHATGKVKLTSEVKNTS